LAGAPCIVKPRVAQALGLAIYELAANALKYGALTSPDGKVHVEWGIADEAGGRQFKAHMARGRWAARHCTAEERLRSAIIESMIARSGAWNCDRDLCPRRADLGIDRS
jgi:two-component sensor histidine kinase